MYIYLDIVSEFSCAMCGDCCRRPWLVTVDGAGYRRNCAHFAASGREEEFTAAFLPLGEGDPGEYAAIAKQPDGGCWFLGTDNLCRLQREAGPAHLDSVCRLYPRYPVNTSRGVEITLSFSCPEVLRLLERPEPLAVVRSEAPPIAVGNEDFVAAVFPGQQPEHSLLRYYFELEHHFLDIVQSRGLPLTRRLRFLQDTASSLARLPREETGRALSRFLRENYERLDAAVGPAVAGSPAEVLLEHFFANLIFKKTLYLYGLERGMLLFAELWQRLSAVRGRPAPEAADLHRTREAVMELEFDYCHHRRSPLRGRR